MDKKSREAFEDYIKRHPKERAIPCYDLYGLSIDKLVKLRKKQQNRCALCHKRCDDLVLDHNHITHKARGYLCRKCNGLVVGRDDPKLSQQIDEYVKNPPADEFYKKD